MKNRATNRLGKTSLYKAQKEYQCEHCEQTIPRGEIYVTFSALGRKGDKVTFFSNTRVHIDCSPGYMKENYRLFTERPQHRESNHHPAPGAGGVVKLDKVAPDLLVERRRVMQYIAVYRNKLLREYESGGKNITRYKRKFGEYISEFYAPDSPYKPELTYHMVFGRELGSLLYQTDTRSTEFRALSDAEDYFGLGEWLQDSREEHLRV